MIAGRCNHCGAELDEHGRPLPRPDGERCIVCDARVRRVMFRAPVASLRRAESVEVIDVRRDVVTA